ncbi:MAG: 50S ribosomal protein L23 [Patescibacteria group bacterium]|nr:50S ribosomal protein L23 [Patescibacteria group bacterium]
MLLKPVITEKSMALAQVGQFTFAITANTGKWQVKTAVEKLFSVEVINVRTLKLAAKTRHSSKTRHSRTISPRFKALVTLKPGQMIEYFQLPEKKTKKKKSTK